MGYMEHRNEIKESPLIASEICKTNKALQEKHESFFRVITQVEEYFTISINEYKF